MNKSSTKFELKNLIKSLCYSNSDASMVASEWANGCNLRPVCNDP